MDGYTIAMLVRLVYFAVGLLVCGGSLGCLRHGRHAMAKNGPRMPAGRASTAPSTFSDKQLGVELTYPAGWASKPSAEYVLLLTQPAGGDTISLDVPKLPWHLPGMIRLSLVKNGYLDDLRKLDRALKVVEDSPHHISDAQAGLVRSSWRADGRDYWEMALLMIHADRVYILRVGGNGQEDDPAAKAAFEAVAQSLRWVK